MIDPLIVYAFEMFLPTATAVAGFIFVLLMCTSLIGAVTRMLDHSTDE